MGARLIPERHLPSPRSGNEREDLAGQLRSSFQLESVALDRYWGPNENFVLVKTESSSHLYTDGSHQFI
jgi:hypothetical protein